MAGQVIAVDQWEQRDPSVMRLAGLAYWPGWSLDFPTGGEAARHRHLATPPPRRHWARTPSVALVVTALVLGLAAITTYDAGMALWAEVIIGLVAVRALVRRR